MLSTTEKQRGQVLVIFVGGLVTIMLLAALAFDAGMMLLERRDQQNAADAAALAGARYLPGDGTTAKSAARALATANGFTDGAGTVRVDVQVPPGESTSARFRTESSVEVTISSTRPSVFAGIMGVVGWPVGARAVATNQDDIAAPFAMLALEPTQCQALDVDGKGAIYAAGNIQVNSDCDGPGKAAFLIGGTADVDVDAEPALCSVVGTFDSRGASTYTCVPDSPAEVVLDPLADLPYPTRPDPADPMELISGDPGLKPPTGCPGSEDAATTSEPSLCKIVPGRGYDAAAWRMFPGLYPGGVDLQAGTYYLEPGIYWIGGGGFKAGGNGVTLLSVDADDQTGAVGGGVLLFNSSVDGAALDTIVLNGANATIDLLPLSQGDSIWNGLVIFQERTDIGGDSVMDVTINGGDSDLSVAGTIYVPNGQVYVSGSSGTITVDQVIADQFKIKGNGGTISVLFREEYLFKLIAAGLVE